MYLPQIATSWNLASNTFLLCFLEFDRKSLKNLEHFFFKNGRSASEASGSCYLSYSDVFVIVQHCMKLKIKKTSWLL